MRYRIFQCGLEPVLIHWILICFEAILEKFRQFYSTKFVACLCVLNLILFYIIKKHYIEYLVYYYYQLFLCWFKWQRKYQANFENIFNHILFITFYKNLNLKNYNMKTRIAAFLQSI